MNFSLMYLLAKTPTSGGAAASGNLLMRFFDENTLKRLGAPGAVTCSAWLPAMAAAADAHAEVGWQDAHCTCRPPVHDARWSVCALVCRRQLL